MNNTMNYHIIREFRPKLMTIKEKKQPSIQCKRRTEFGIQNSLLSPSRLDCIVDAKRTLLFFSIVLYKHLSLIYLILTKRISYLHSMNFY